MRPDVDIREHEELCSDNLLPNQPGLGDEVERAMSADEFMGSRRHDPSWMGHLLLRFLHEEDEEAFLRAQTNVTATTFIAIGVCMLIANILHTVATLAAHGWPDFGPLAGSTFLTYALWRAETMSRSRSLRLLTIAMLALYLNLRLSIGILFLPASYAPKLALFGQPLPYSLLGAPGLIVLGNLLGLRMRDTLPYLPPTLFTSCWHMLAVLPEEHTASRYNYTVTTFVMTMLGYVAGYHAECTKRRRWMWYPYSDPIPSAAIDTHAVCPGNSSGVSLWQLVHSFTLVFSDDEDERAFIRSETEFSKVQVKLPIFMCANALTALLAVAIKTPYIFWNSMLLTVLIACREPLSRRHILRRLVHGLLVLVGCYRLVCTLPIRSDDPTTAEGHLLPYSLQGVPLVWWMGDLMGLRPMADMALFSVLAGAAQCVHIWRFSGHYPAAVCTNYFVIATLAFFVTGGAHYKYDRDMRIRWLSWRNARTAGAPVAVAL